MKGFGGTAATAALMLMSGATLGGEAAVSAYKMAVITNDAYGRAVMSGEYAKGIARINSYGSKRAGTFAAQNNLCVAYTVTKEFAQAAPACEAAVSIGKRAGRFGGTPINPNGSRDLALAYSNRGVLRAVSGDVEGAMQDFAEAAEVHADHVAAAENLALLKAKETTAMSSL